MTNERFQELVKELRDKSMDTMLKKNANYADEDRLHNFKVGAAITGGTPAQAALGYMAKHLASLQDKVRNNDFHDREDLLEKCQDIINYVVFIWCCGNEEMEKYTQGCDGVMRDTKTNEPITGKSLPVERVNGCFDQAKMKKVPSLDELIRFETGN